MSSCKAKAQLDQHPKHGQLVSLNVTLYPDNSPSMGSAWSRGWPLEGDDKRTLFNELVEFASRYNVDYALVKAEVERALAEAKPYVREETFAMPAGVEEEEVAVLKPGENVVVDGHRVTSSKDSTGDLTVTKVVDAPEEARGFIEDHSGETKEGVTLDDLDEIRKKT